MDINLVTLLPPLPFLFMLPLLLLLLLRVQVLGRRDALHVGAELVHRLEPLLVLVRVEDDAAACFTRGCYVSSITHLPY